MTEETTFWKASPSQWINIGPFTFAILLTAAIIAGAISSGPTAPFILIGLAIPLIYAIWKYLTVRCKTFELTTQRLRISTGVINQDIDEIELYRVKDILVERKWWMRLTGLGTVHLETSDRSLPQLEIIAVHDSIKLREELRRLVEAMRDSKRVREMDFDETGDSKSFGEFEEIG